MSYDPTSNLSNESHNISWERRSRMMRIRNVPIDTRVRTPMRTDLFVKEMAEMRGTTRWCEPKDDEWWNGGWWFHQSWLVPVEES